MRKKLIGNLVALASALVALSAYGVYRYGSESVQHLEHHHDQ